MAATDARPEDGERRTGSALPGGSGANRAVMDQIAAAFDETRRAPWEQVVAFLQALPRGSRVLDLAGGNGRHAMAALEVPLRPVLVDVSAALVRLARRHADAEGRRLAAVEADAGHLPFATGAFDAAVYVAGVHCIRGRQERLRTLRELRRVVRPGGPMLVTVWSAEQDRFREIVAGQRRAEATDALTTDQEVGDVLVPWSRGQDAPVERFFHVYDKDELRRDLEDARLIVERIDGVTLTRSTAPDNWFATVRGP